MNCQDILFFSLIGLGLYFFLFDTNLVKNNGSINTPVLKNIDSKPIDQYTTLGVDLDDPKFQKFKIQAPNYELDKVKTSDLLPKESNDDWDWDVPQQKLTIDEANLLIEATNKIGTNTQGNTLKNASWDLRGNIANPKFQVSVFNNSSYEPDMNLKDKF